MPLLTSGDRPDLFELERVTEIGVPFEEFDLLHFTSMRTSIPQDIEAVADVYHIDQAVPDNRVTPQHNLIRPTAQSRVLGGDLVERLW